MTIELLTSIPYAYWLYTEGKLKETSSAHDTKCFYYFSPKHQEIWTNRVHICGMSGRYRTKTPIVDVHTMQAEALDHMWAMPPYKEKYKNDLFVFDKPILVISNKHNNEWGMPLHFLDYGALETLICMLKGHYQIVYNRPVERDIPFDENLPLEWYDFDEVIAKYPEVITMQKLKNVSKESFNTTQLMVYANCDRFISTSGGNSVLCSLFGGINLIYARFGEFLENGGFENWFHKLSGCKVIVCLDKINRPAIPPYPPKNYTALYEAAEREFLNVAK